MLFRGVNELIWVKFLILLFCNFFEVLFNIKLVLLIVIMKIKKFKNIIVIIVDIL